MYCVAMRHLSGIQKGIQAAHAIVHYSNKFGKTSEYYQWSRKDESITLLEIHSNKEMEKAVRKLKRLGIENIAIFKEPDLCDVPTIAFLVDERIWHVSKYGDNIPVNLLVLRDYLKTFNLASN
jgi:hypothetical protein